MTNEERDIITRFIERVGGAQPTVSGSVPGTTPALPPVDREADTLIGDLFQRYPEARYRLTQTAFVQEHALAEAQNRIKRLEWEVEQARQAPQPASQPGQSRGFFGSLFGAGQSHSAPPQPQYQAAPQYQSAPQYAAAPPPPQYAPSYQPGMFQRSGSGFLGSALTTAAGVAGGMVVGNALMDMFSPHQGFGGGLGGGLGGGGFGGGVPASPWGNAPGGAPGGGWDQQNLGSDPNAGAGGGWDQQVEGPDNSVAGGWDTSQAGPDPNVDTGAGWDQGASNDDASGGGWDQGGGVDNSGGGGGGGWDDNS
ncbi:MAG: DUF2076 domain-containing protein [Acidisphaera sp.]|nr:DUF2076 domain-containing protein [Acidisphaera sp.]